MPKLRTWSARWSIQADFKMIVSNIGIVPDFSALYTTNAGPYTATIQVALNDSHRVSSFEYMDRLRRQIAAKYPDLRRSSPAARWSTRS